MKQVPDLTQAKAIAIAFGLCILGLLACGGSKGVAAVILPAQSVAISLNPMAVSLQTGGTSAFTATVTGTNNTVVNWGVVEAGGGTVSSLGVYTAPGTAGTYHVRATSAADTTQSAQATVTVSATTVPVTGVTLNKPATTLVVGGTESLVATLAPSNATNQAVTWASSNTGVATVANGVVTAKTAGTATITVTTVDGTKTATCAVTVSATTVPVTGVTLNKSATTLAVGGTEALAVTITPSNATNQSISWASSNTAVATVANGVVTALAAGTTTITVTTVDGMRTATCAVTVSATTVPVTGVTLNKTATTLTVSGTEMLTATIAPSGATNQTISWASSNTAVATVANGVVTAKTVGTATITVTTVDGTKTDTCAVTVSATTVPVTGVTLNKTATTLPVGGTETLTATIAPSGATNLAVTWASSNTGVATVANGVVRAVALGTTTITVTTANGKTATCSVTVNAASVPVADLVLNKTATTLGIGTSEPLTGRLLPMNATNQNLTWSAATNASATVATVDGSGRVTGVAAGFATITATAQDGGKSARCFVTVVPRAVSVTGITLTKNATPLLVRGNEALSVTVLPGSATNQNVTWSSSDPTRVTVSSSGLVTGVAVGAATITVTTVDGAQQDTCLVTVNAAPAPPTITSFAASPTPVTSGQNTPLTWAVTGATSLSLRGIGSVTGSTYSVSPLTTTVYTLVATNALGESVSSDATVTVTPTLVAPTITAFTTASDRIWPGAFTTLSWKVAGASTLTLSGVGGVQDAAGHAQVAPTATTTYTLTATNSAGSAQQSLTVNVDATNHNPAPIITRFMASPDNPPGPSNTLSWSVTRATSLNLSVVGVVSAPTGTASVSPGAPTTYNLTATNASGTSTASVGVNAAASAPIITSFTATPDTLVSGTCTLAWDVKGATTLTITGVGAVAGPTGNQVLSPTGTTTYVLVATNAMGSVSQPITVVMPGSNRSGTPLSGTVGGTLTLANSPYLVQGDLRVSNGTRLTIEPGVELRFMGHYKLWVQGGLTAQGTAAHPIVFTAPDHMSGWYGIRIWGGDTAADPNAHLDTVEQWIEHCVIEWVVKDPGGLPDAAYNNSRGGLFVDLGGTQAGSDGTKLAHINHNLFRHNRCISKGAALSLSSAMGGPWVITGNLFEDNTADLQGGALDFRHAGTLNILGGAFRRNRGKKLDDDPGVGGAIHVFDSILNLSEVILEGNQPDDFGGGDIYVNGILVQSYLAGAS